ncbi:MAG: hypothetical protein NTW65_04585 [Deltaproteobacteria bacterium]|nr:hypothetical protein [Deltaproteobacteria bacterium]
MVTTEKHGRHSSGMSLKARIYLALSLFIPFAMIFIYVWITATDLAFRDDIYLIKGGFIESYCKGSLTFADLWRPSAGIRFLGYNILQVANIKWFSMNSKLIVLMIPFLMLASALLIYRDYRKSLAPERSPQFIAATFLVLTLIIFNIIQWEGLTFPFSLVFQFPVPFFIASFICLELFLTKGEAKYWPAALILPALAVLVFGGSSFIAFAPALGATCICYILTRCNSLTKEFWLRVVVMGVFLAMLVFLYMYKIHYNDYFPNSSYRVAEVFARPLEALKFLLAAFGASVVGVDAANAHFSFRTTVVLGIAVVLLYALALVLFFRSRMYERTYLPFFLITQTFFYLAFMTMGRFIYGIEYGMASRYTCVSIYGLAALTWIFIFILVQPLRPNALLKSTICAGFVMIFAGLLLTTVVEWRIQPDRKIYFEQINAIAMRVDTATPEELAKFEERPELVRDSLRLLREHRLNAYCAVPADS